nr:uncharacterized protein LOC127328605 [Lolium perenne]
MAYLLLYVNDIIVTASSTEFLQQLLDRCQQRQPATRSGPPRPPGHRRSWEQPPHDRRAETPRDPPSSAQPPCRGKAGRPNPSTTASPGPPPRLASAGEHQLRAGPDRALPGPDPAPTRQRSSSPPPMPHVAAPAMSHASARPGSSPPSPDPARTDEREHLPTSLRPWHCPHSHHGRRTCRRCPGAAAPRALLRRRQPAVRGVAPLQPETPAHEGGGPAAAGYQTGFARWLRLAATRGADGGGRRLGC